MNGGGEASCLEAHALPCRVLVSSATRQGWDDFDGDGSVVDGQNDCCEHEREKMSSGSLMA